MFREIPRFDGHDFDAGDAAHHDDGGVRDREANLRIRHEIAESGRINQIDLMLIPFAIGDCRIYRNFPLLFIVIKIRSRGSVINFAEARHHFCIE